jgi:hypothetical protein
MENKKVEREQRLWKKGFWMLMEIWPISFTALGIILYLITYACAYTDDPYRKLLFHSLNFITIVFSVIFLPYIVGRMSEGEIE